MEYRIDRNAGMEILRRAVKIMRKEYEGLSKAWDAALEAESRWHAVDRMYEAWMDREESDRSAESEGELRDEQSGLLLDDIMSAVISKRAYVALIPIENMIRDLVSDPDGDLSRSERQCLIDACIVARYLQAMVHRGQREQKGRPGAP